MSSIEKQPKTIMMVGFDSAWTANNRGALVSALWDAECGLATIDLPQAANFNEAEQRIRGWQQSHQPDRTIVLIDQPTIVPNDTGQRPVEHLVSSVISRRYGGMQPANRARDGMFGDGAPVWPFLHGFGGAVLPEQQAGRNEVFEVYPTLTLAALNWLRPDPNGRSTGRFPKYNPANSSKFKLEDWKYVCRQVAEHLSAIGPGCRSLIDHALELAQLRRPRKADQDQIDACLCLIVGWHYLNGQGWIIGNAQTGYILTPLNATVLVELNARAQQTGRTAEQWIYPVSSLASGLVSDGIGLLDHCEISVADRPESPDAFSVSHRNHEQASISVDLPVWLLGAIDREAARVGVTRENLIKIWLTERLQEEAVNSP